MTSIDWRTRLAIHGQALRYDQKLFKWWFALGLALLINSAAYVVSQSSFPPGHIDTARKEVVQIQQAIEMYRVQRRGKCPSRFVDLKASGLLNKIREDPWGQAYRFECDADRNFIFVASSGPDAEIDTVDDITNLGSLH